jgi:DNA-binding transcriptional LysR family regulator
MQTLQSMRLFIKVVQSGSLSAAGRHFGLSPASVSRHLSALEDDLGVRLLNRTSRKLSLTEAGRLYRQRAERLLLDFDETRDVVAQLAVRPSGTLRVHARISLGSQHIAPLIPDLLLLYPDLHIDLWLADADLDLVEHDIDVAIRVGPLSDSSLIVRKLCSSPRVVCGSPAYLARNPAPMTPDDLVSHNCLTYRFDFGTPIWRFLGKGDALFEIRASGNFQTNNAEALRVAALSGLGLALLPVWSIHDDLAAGRLLCVLEDYEATPTAFDTGIYAVHNSHRYVSAKTRVFIDHLVEAFRNRNWDMTNAGLTA